MTSRIAVALAALSANYTMLDGHTEGRLAPVVKADAYGLGALPVAGHLAAHHGCGHFFTATAAEAQRLRRSLPDVDIYVFEGVFADTLPDLLAANATPVLNSLQQIKLWSGTGQSAAVHIDTGMQRLGLAPEHWQQVPDDLSVDLMLTHLAHADEREHPQNAHQLRTIQSLYQAALTKRPKLILSALNSGGLLQGLLGAELARPGIALYGGNPFVEQTSVTIEPVVGLYGRVLQLREVPAGTAVGYGGTYLCAQDSRLATLGIGYADGVPRLLSNRGRAWLNGGHAPIVGRVSMDLLHLDVTGMTVEVGDWAEIFGAHIGLGEVARLAQTIDYEILTGLGQRPTRHYLSGHLPVDNRLLLQV